MRLYVKCFHTGVMPGPHVFMRDVLVPCEPRPIARDVKEGIVSSSIHSRINERAGFKRQRRCVGSYGIIESKLKNGRVIYSRMYGVDKELPWEA